MVVREEEGAVGTSCCEAQRGEQSDELFSPTTLLNEAIPGAGGCLGSTEGRQ